MTLASGSCAGSRSTRTCCSTTRTMHVRSHQASRCWRAPSVSGLSPLARAAAPSLALTSTNRSVLHRDLIVQVTKTRSSAVAESPRDVRSMSLEILLIHSRSLDFDQSVNQLMRNLCSSPLIGNYHEGVVCSPYVRL